MPDPDRPTLLARARWLLHGATTGQLRRVCRELEQAEYDRELPPLPPRVAEVDRLAAGRHGTLTPLPPGWPAGWGVR